MKEASIVASALYLDRPFFGSRRMAVTLGVGRTRIRRLMRILAIEAHYPKRNLSRPIPGRVPSENG
jgi:putative transposase